MRSETRVVMLTDIKGFTAATSRQTREENARMLTLHDALLSPVVRAFGGRRVKTIGDAYLVVFGAPTDALLCAMAIQDRLWDYDQRVSEAKRIEVRIALALGEVRMVREGGGQDVYGEAVNLAARIESEAAAGEIWFGEAVWWVMSRAYVPWEEIGTRSLKGLPEPVRLFRVAHSARDIEKPPYGGAGLAYVDGLEPPDPERLARKVSVARPSGRRGPRAAVTALALATVAGAAAGVVHWVRNPGPDRLIAAGRFDEAAERIDVIARERGDEDPKVLYLRGRVELGRGDAGQGGSKREGFRLLSRALAAGSGDALAMLREQSESEDCARRRSAAHALVDSGSRDALGALRALSAAEAPPPEPANALERLRTWVGADGRCGAGDIAREGIAALDPE